MPKHSQKYLMSCTLILNGKLLNRKERLALIEPYSYFSIGDWYAWFPYRLLSSNAIFFITSIVLYRVFPIGLHKNLITRIVFFF